MCCGLVSCRLLVDLRFLGCVNVSSRFVSDILLCVFGVVLLGVVLEFGGVRMCWLGLLEFLKIEDFGKLMEFGKFMKVGRFW
jgi:hypothetical protein